MSKEKKKKKKYYVNPKELKNELKKYKDSDGVISEELGVMILNIARHYVSRPNFSGYTYKEEFISSSVHRMIEQLDKIDLNHPKCNPFAYLTQMCYYKCIAKINSEKKYQNLKLKLKERNLDEFERLEGIHLNKNINDDLDFFYDEDENNSPDDN